MSRAARKRTGLAVAAWFAEMLTGLRTSEFGKDESRAVAIEHLLPCAAGEKKKWPHEQITPLKPERLRYVLHQAAAAGARRGAAELCVRCAKALAVLPGADLARENLLIPLVPLKSDSGS